MGIYGNLEKLVSFRGGGLLFHILSGDDAMDPYLLSETQGFIASSNINVIDNATCIYADFKTICPDGIETIYQNKRVLKGGNLFGLAIRKLIFNRSLTVSSKVLDLYKPVILDEVITLSEVLFDRQMQLHADKSNYVGPL